MYKIAILLSVILVTNSCKDKSTINDGEQSIKVNKTKEDSVLEVEDTEKTDLKILSGEKSEKAYQLEKH